MSFPEVDKEQWRARVDKELGDKSFEKVLLSTVGDIVLQPLYSDPSPDVGGPGRFPFVRGAADAEPSWEICQRYAHPDLKTTNRHILQDLMGGATGIWVELDRSGRVGLEELAARGVDGLYLPSLSDWKTLLKEVELSAISLRLRPGANGLVAAGMVSALCAEQGTDLASLDISWGMDPLAAFTADGVLPFTTGEAERQLVDLTKWSMTACPNARACLVSTLGYHDAGATAVTELAYALATGIHYLRALDEGGVPPQDAHRHIEFNLAVGSEVFVEIAKFRALRMLWSRALSAAGVEPRAGATIHACTSHRSLAKRDPWVNALRMTTQTLAAAVGGANSIATQRFDRAHAHPENVDLGRRVARNTQVILQREGGLGWVTDPAGGSYYVEEVTRELAEAAWERMRSIESAGGMEAFIKSGTLHEDLHRAWDERAARLDTRAVPVLGVSEYASVDHAGPEPVAADGKPSGASETNDPMGGAGVSDCAEALRRGLTLVQCTTAVRAGEPRAQGSKLVAHRDAERFEAIRDAMDRVADAEGRPRVYLACLGPLAQHNARAMFAHNAFAAGGFEVQQGGGTGDADPHETARLLQAGFQASSAAVACLCGTDDAYNEAGPSVVRALREGGCKRVVLAGKPKGTMAEVPLEGAVHLGSDLRALLVELAAACGADLGGGTGGEGNP